MAAVIPAPLRGVGTAWPSRPWATPCNPRYTLTRYSQPIPLIRISLVDSQMSYGRDKSNT